MPGSSGTTRGREDGSAWAKEALAPTVAWSGSHQTDEDAPLDQIADDLAQGVLPSRWPYL